MMDALEDKWTIQRWDSTVSVRIYKSRDEQSGSFGTVWGEESGGWVMMKDLLIRDTGTGLDVLPGFSTKYLSQQNGSESIVTKWLSMTRQLDSNGKIKACMKDPLRAGLSSLKRFGDLFKSGQLRVFASLYSDLYSMSNPSLTLV